MYKILLVDDHDIILDGLKAMIDKIPNYEVVGEAKNGFDAIAKTIEFKPDVIIMDISMPDMNGIEATETIRKKFSKTKILVLTQHDTKEYILQMIRAGADGYLHKNCKKNELLEGIETVLSNNKYFGKNISDISSHTDDLPLNSDTEESDPKAVLSPREIEIIKCIAADMKNQEIADKLFISLRTVETHRRNIMQKLDLKSAVALMKYAVKHGIANL